MRQLFRQLFFPGGILSHVAAETPDSINEGRELGYSLVHAYGELLANLVYGGQATFRSDAS